MKDWSPFFKGKKITVMGLGLLGRGVGDAKFLAEQGAELIITDLKAEEQLKDSLDQLKGFSNIAYRLGGHDLADFKGRDFILKAAGVPLDSPYIGEARANGIPIKMSASWFAELAGIPTVGVTGTRGKTTVTYMLYDIMRAAGIQVLLGGNIRGVSTLALLDEVTNDSVALMELDSWQLQGWGESKMSPHIAVFTTFFDDHLNYYKGDREAYLADKAQIFLHQKPGDSLILGEQARQVVEVKYPAIRASGTRVDVRGIMALPESLTLRVPGEHNRYDAALARGAAEALGIGEDAIQSALKDFKGVPGRLELVREVNGVKIYNDTTATTPDATLAALKALYTGERNIILIMGGADKGLDMSVLAAELPGCKNVILLGGSGTDRVKSQLLYAPIYRSLKFAVADALASATAGDSIAFSPAFASFGMFKNEYDRGDQFNELIQKIPDLNLLKPKVRALAEQLVEECRKEGFRIVISRGYRSTEEQDFFYEQGRTRPGPIITMAQGGQSFHNYGAAFDIGLIEEDEEKRTELYKKAGAVGMRLGLEWGGTWKEFVDLPHFQYAAGYSIEDFKNGKIEESAFK